MMYINEKKKGIKGILYLTNAPKLVPAIPTPKAKNKEKTKQQTKKGSLKVSLKNLKGPIRIRE